MILTIALWTLVALILAGSFISWLRRRPTPRPALAPDAPLEDQILDVASALGAEAAAQRFSVPLKTVRRLRVIHGLEAKTCGTCEFFDLSKGQLAIKSHNTMRDVTQALPPATISRDPMNTQSWSDFGACLKQPGTIIGATDWCGNPKHKTEDMWT